MGHLFVPFNIAWKCIQVQKKPSIGQVVHNIASLVFDKILSNFTFYTVKLYSVCQGLKHVKLFQTSMLVVLEGKTKL